jgi:uncharacterized membrane protein YcfT
MTRLARADRSATTNADEEDACLPVDKQRLTQTVSGVSTPLKRVLWVDAAKGFAIILVVFGHVLGGMMARGWLDPEGPFRQLYNYIYLFHMPLFFMISGLFCI